MIPTRRFVVAMIAFYEEGRVFRQGVGRSAAERIAVGLAILDFLRI